MYTDMLTDVCLHSGISSVQKLALLGTHKDLAGVKVRGREVLYCDRGVFSHSIIVFNFISGDSITCLYFQKHEGSVACPMVSAALLDLISFKAFDEKLDGGRCLWGAVAQCSHTYSSAIMFP